MIQRASERALAQGTTLARVLELVRALRRTSELPLLLFSYFNPLLRYGLERLASDARDAGVDGVLVTDLPPEEADEWLAVARPRGPRHGLPGGADQPRRAPAARGGRVARASSTRSAAPASPASSDALSDEARPLVDAPARAHRRAGGAGLRHLDARAGGGGGRGRGRRGGGQRARALPGGASPAGRSPRREGAMAEERDVSADDRAKAGAGGIDDWRKRIDLIDAQLMGLLNSRSACAVEIGRIKRDGRAARLLARARGAGARPRGAREPGPARPDGGPARVRTDHRREPPAGAPGGRGPRERRRPWSS